MNRALRLGQIESRSATGWEPKGKRDRLGPSRQNKWLGIPGMAREISVHEVAQDVLRAEMRHLIQYLRDRGHEHCELVFGWHWGMEYPKGTPWATMHIPLAELETEVQKPEDAGLGEFGGDDVTIRVPPLDCEFLFCHHEGIHLTFSQPGQVAEDFRARWTSAGLTPKETDSGPSGERVG
jgi:hypothetical protein